MKRNKMLMEEKQINNKLMARQDSAELVRLVELKNPYKDFFLNSI